MWCISHKGVVSKEEVRQYLMFHNEKTPPTIFILLYVF